MSVTSAADLFDVLEEHQLLDFNHLQEIRQQLADPMPDSQVLAELLLERGWLTRYQVDLLLQGRVAELFLGPYRLLEPLGEGGMGQVFKAVHRRLGRVVALKAIRQERLSQDPESIRRFQREARAAAQLAHPNVVIVYDADQVGSNYFIAMEYIEGTDLSQLVKQSGPLPVAQACDFIRQAALGLQHAHESGMVHRDIKPSNLLVTRGPSSGGRDSSPFLHLSRSGVYMHWGVVKILDMGLVRLAQSTDPQAAEGSLTREGSVIGTPDYIAPEQARNAHRVDIRADLYSLGCTFYYLLTGRPPFAEGGVIEKLLMHQMDQPQPVEELRPEVPPEVSAIVTKLMAKCPEDRYQEPIQLADALAALKLDSVPSQPTPQPLRRQPDSSTNTDVVPVAPTPTPSTAQLDQLAGTLIPKKIASLPGHRGWVTALAFSLSRDLLATAGVDGGLRLWDFRGKKPIDHNAQPLHRGEIHALAFSPDNGLLASASGTIDGAVWLWDVATDGLHQRGALRKHRAPVEALAFTTDCKMLATAGSDRTIYLWDLGGPEPRERAMLKGHTDSVQALAFTSDARKLASGSQDGTVRVWSISKIWSREQAVLPGHEGNVRTVAFSPDGRLVASGSVDQTIRLWDVSDLKPIPLAVFEGHQGGVRQIQFAPDGKSLLSIEDRSRVFVWEVSSGRKLREWILPEAMICSTAFTFDGRYTALGTQGGKTYVFRLVPQA
jgi:serine/threonine protein kinase